MTYGSPLGIDRISGFVNQRIAKQRIKDNIYSRNQCSLTNQFSFHMKMEYGSTINVILGSLPGYSLIW